jgi:hypothetical protein
VYNESGNYLYYETNPSAFGTMDIGLYIDSRCALDYAGSISLKPVFYKNFNGQVDNEDLEFFFVTAFGLNVYDTEKVKNHFKSHIFTQLLFYLEFG